ncbi:uncharacterized protein LOC119406469 [Rhipicephalus sanguineus]|uniref:uncharacterized protein LOC119406469 n=1 Tax=Rhipicephalus sanguineus TaxID=34632 RepID=UPI001893A574|nr:uncharacterized protein LOC119406469 [Rhipicephalus sanguineus]
MKGLSERLATVRGANHALYADDITVWCMGGSDAGVEQALQEALDITENFLVGSGLSLSSAKSELLLYRPTRQGLRNLTSLEQIPIALHRRAGQKIPRVDSIRVLGLLLESKGGNSRTIARITSKTENMLRLILRVSNRRDSRSAARAFASGSISREAAAILGCEGAVGFHTITWFPAHMGANVHPNVPNANEFAHDRARGKSLPVEEAVELPPRTKIRLLQAENPHLPLERR